MYIEQRFFSISLRAESTPTRKNTKQDRNFHSSTDIKEMGAILHLPLRS
jgi:hypothetical protein